MNSSSIAAIQMPKVEHLKVVKPKAEIKHIPSVSNTLPMRTSYERQLQNPTAKKAFQSTVAKYSLYSADSNFSMSKRSYTAI